MQQHDCPPRHFKIRQTVNLQNIDCLTLVETDPPQSHEWYNFFEATIHKNPALSDAQRIAYLQKSVSRKGKDCIVGKS